MPELVVAPLGTHLPSHGGPGDPWRPIDVQLGSGLRMVACERFPGVWRVVLQVHHAVCDGLSGMELFGDVWSHYHGNPPAAFRQPTRRLAAPSAPAPAASPQPPSTDLVRETRKFAGFIPTPLARGPVRAVAEPACPGIDAPYLTFRFSREETRLLWTHAAAAGVAVNDILVAAMMRTCLAWNAAAGHPASGVRITMPVSLKAAGARGPVCNDMSYAFLDRSAADCARPSELIHSLAAASHWIQEHRATEALLDTLAVLDRYPPLIWLITRLPVCLSTAVVSNIGNFGTRMKASVPHDGACGLPGGLRITAAGGVPPLRPGTRLAVGLATYDSQLQLSLLCDRRSLGDAAQSLLAEMIRPSVFGCAAALSHWGGADAPAGEPRPPEPSRDNRGPLPTVRGRI
ncbi:MAG: hypothetical protein DWH79_00645 [Planctomycetota bacterium]|nr:MAG: hypothetical protein DWH79_00645 [Planctomycetota bacterium]